MGHRTQAARSERHDEHASLRQPRDHDLRAIALPGKVDHDNVRLRHGWTDGAALGQSLGAPAAFNSRAPSRWTGNPAARATATMASMVAGAMTFPPAALCVFSTAMAPARGTWGVAGLSAE